MLFSTYALERLLENINRRDFMKVLIFSSVIIPPILFFILSGGFHAKSSIFALLITLLINLLFILMFLLFTLKIRRREYAMYVLFLFIFADQLLFLRGKSIPSDYYKNVRMKAVIFDKIKQYVMEPSRFIITDGIVKPTENMLYGLQTTDGYDPLNVGLYVDFHNKISKKRALLANITGVYTDFESRSADILNVRYVVSLRPILHEKLRLINVVDGLFLYENIHSYPRVYFAEKVEFLQDDEIIKKMMGYDYVKDKMVFFGIRLKGEFEGPSVKGRREEGREAGIIFVEYDNDRIIMDVNNPEDGFLVLADTYYPGWKAYDNGKKTEIFRANYFMRAIRLPQGEHRVVFEYDPWTYRVGRVLSIIGLIFTIIIWVNHKKLNEWWS